MLKPALVDRRLLTRLLVIPNDDDGAKGLGDPRGAAQAPHPGGCHDDQDAAATPRPRPGATTLRTDLDAVSSGAGEGIMACDLLTVEAIRPDRLQVLCLIQPSTRRVA
jgi:hypothetical protein